MSEYLHIHQEQRIDMMSIPVLKLKWDLPAVLEFLQQYPPEKQENNTSFTYQTTICSILVHSVDMHANEKDQKLNNLELLILMKVQHKLHTKC